MPENQALKVSIFDKFQDDKLFTQVWDRPSHPAFFSFSSSPFQILPPRALTDVPREGVAGWGNLLV